MTSDGCPQNENISQYDDRSTDLDSKAALPQIADFHHHQTAVVINGGNEESIILSPVRNNPGACHILHLLRQQQQQESPSSRMMTMLVSNPPLVLRDSSAFALDGSRSIDALISPEDGFEPSWRSRFRRWLSRQYNHLSLSRSSEPKSDFAHLSLTTTSSFGGAPGWSSPGSSVVVPPYSPSNPPCIEAVPASLVKLRVISIIVPVLALSLSLLIILTVLFTTIIPREIEAMMNKAEIDWESISLFDNSNASFRLEAKGIAHVATSIHSEVVFPYGLDAFYLEMPPGRSLHENLEYGDVESVLALARGKNRLGMIEIENGIEAADEETVSIRGTTYIDDISVFDQALDQILTGSKSPVLWFLTGKAVVKIYGLNFRNLQSKRILPLRSIALPNVDTLVDSSEVSASPIKLVVKSVVLDAEASSEMYLAFSGVLEIHNNGLIGMDTLGLETMTLRSIEDGEGVIALKLDRMPFQRGLNEMKFKGRLMLDDSHGHELIQNFMNHEDTSLQLRVDEVSDGNLVADSLKKRIDMRFTIPGDGSNSSYLLSRRLIDLTVGLDSHVAGSPASSSGERRKPFGAFPHTAVSVYSRAEKVAAKDQRRMARQMKRKRRRQLSEAMPPLWSSIFGVTGGIMGGILASLGMNATSSNPHQNSVESQQQQHPLEESSESMIKSISGLVFDSLSNAQGYFRMTPSRPYRVLVWDAPISSIVTSNDLDSFQINGVALLGIWTPFGNRTRIKDISVNGLVRMKTSSKKIHPWMNVAEISGMLNEEAISPIGGEREELEASLLGDEFPGDNEMVQRGLLIGYTDLKKLRFNIRPRLTMSSDVLMKEIMRGSAMEVETEITSAHANVMAGDKVTLPIEESSNMIERFKIETDLMMTVESISIVEEVPELAFKVVLNMSWGAPLALEIDEPIYLDWDLGAIKGGPMTINKLSVNAAAAAPSIITIYLGFYEESLPLLVLPLMSNLLNQRNAQFCISRRSAFSPEELSSIGRSPIFKILSHLEYYCINATLGSASSNLASQLFPIVKKLGDIAKANVDRYDDDDDDEDQDEDTAARDHYLDDNINAHKYYLDQRLNQRLH